MEIGLEDHQSILRELHLTHNILPDEDLREWGDTSDWTRLENSVWKSTTCYVALSGGMANTVTYQCGKNSRKVESIALIKKIHITKLSAPATAEVSEPTIMCLRSLQKYVAICGEFQGGDDS